MSDNSEWYESFFNGLYGRVLAATFDESQTRAHVQTVKRVLGLRRPKGR